MVASLSSSAIVEEENEETIEVLGGHVTSCALDFPLQTEQPLDCLYQMKDHGLEQEQSLMEVTLSSHSFHYYHPSSCFCKNKSIQDMRLK